MSGWQPVECFYEGDTIEVRQVYIQQYQRRV